MSYDEPGIRYPKRRDDWMRDHPLASRLLIMLAGFAVLVPVALIVRSSQGNVVRSGGLPGASLSGDPLISPTTTVAVVAAVVPPTSAPVTTAASTTVAPAQVAAAEVPAATSAPTTA